MRVDLFDFDLPTDAIALRPAEPRDSARLLLVDGDQRADRIVADLPLLLNKGDLLVFNDTRVIPAQLVGERQRRGTPGAKVGFTLHMKKASDCWAAFAKGAKKLAVGDIVIFADDFSAKVVFKGADGEVELAFNVADSALDAALASHGHIPLPPYIASKRPDDARDRLDYQTIYARENGAVAAPTAGLHFTDNLLAALDQRGIEKAFVTLHVGAGTFLPVKAEDTVEHKMHAEIGYISQEAAAAINAARNQGGRIVCVGTTSLRLLETAANNDGTIEPWSGATDIFITPGYKFKCVDMLMTNFHLPKSTLMMLVSAFAGMDEMRGAYKYAIENGYRFYSYGDSSLLKRSQKR